MQNLVPHTGGQPMVVQRCTEGAQLLQQLRQGVGRGCRGPAVARRAGGRQALNGLTLQHGSN